MLDTRDYTIGVNDHQGNRNEYNGLTGDWRNYYDVASGFAHRVRPEDREDVLHSTMLVMAQTKLKYDTMGKELSKAGLTRIACFEVAGYWRRLFTQAQACNCGQCNQKQRRECKENTLHSCPRARKVELLETIITDNEGSDIELVQMIADDQQVDVASRLDARLTLQGYPHRFIRIAYKKYAGYPLTNEERIYLYRQRNKVHKIAQKRLELV
jgi:hypothetical protein